VSHEQIRKPVRHRPGLGGRFNDFRTMHALIWLGLCLLVAIPGTLQAEDEPANPGRPLWLGTFEPPEPNPGGWDWLLLDSGEWIKGELLLMRDFDLQFDSDEFGVVDLDWEDVKELITERVYTFVLQDMKTTHVGTVAMRGDIVSVNVGGEIEILDRAQILAITPGAFSELNLWSARASAGFAYRSGNTDSADITGDLRLAREGKNTRWLTTYKGAYGSLDQEKNTNNHRGRTNLDYFLTRDLYLTPGFFEVFSDEFQNVSYRLTPAAGAGYYLIRRPAIEWQARLLGGYQHTRIDEVNKTGSSNSKTADNGAIIFGSTLDTDITSDIDFILEYQLQLIVPDTDNTNHHTEARTEIELTSAIDLDVSVVWDRIENPEKEANGDRPERDDIRVSVGLAVEY
jgi:putative salt-induced outer membrane protein YdiY